MTESELEICTGRDQYHDIKCHIDRFEGERRNSNPPLSPWFRPVSSGCWAADAQSASSRGAPWLRARQQCHISGPAPLICFQKRLHIHSRLINPFSFSPNVFFTISFRLSNAPRCPWSLFNSCVTMGMMCSMTWLAGISVAQEKRLR